MTRMNKNFLFHYGDLSPEVQAQDTRTWGVQVLIVRDGTVFVRKDPDAGNRTEATIRMHRVFFPEQMLRLNSASGGKKAGEDLAACAFREMKSELGIEGSGALRIMEELPIVAAGQIRAVDGQEKGSLLGVIVAAYEPTEDEWITLRDKGEVIPVEQILEMAADDNELTMRPTFKTALQIAQLWEEKAIGGINSLVESTNGLIVWAMRRECCNNGIGLKAGVFGGRE